MGTSRTLLDAKSAGARTKRRRAGPYQQVPRLLLFLGRLQLGAISLIPVPELEPPGSISPPWEIIPWGAPNWVWTAAAAEDTDRNLGTSVSNICPFGRVLIL